MSQLARGPMASDFMTRHVHFVAPDTTVADVIQLLLKHKLSNAPLVATRGGKHVLAGFISERDCLALLSSESFYGSPSPPQTGRTIMRFIR